MSSQTTRVLKQLRAKLESRVQNQRAHDRSASRLAETARTVRDPILWEKHHSFLRWVRFSRRSTAIWRTEPGSPLDCPSGEHFHSEAYATRCETDHPSNWWIGPRVSLWRCQVRERPMIGRCVSAVILFSSFLCFCSCSGVYRIIYCWIDNPLRCT